MTEHDRDFLSAALVGYRWYLDQVEQKIAQVRRLLRPRRTRRTPTPEPRPQRRRRYKARKYWTADAIDQLRELYPDRPTKQIAELLGHSTLSVYGKASQLGLAKSAERRKACGFQNGHTLSRATQFPKGHVPANKGLRRPGWFAGRMRETQFKKGQRSGIASKNWKPIGTILPDSYGYLRIKVREAVHGKEPTGWGNPDVWPQLHIHLWRKHHGPVPRGHVVAFKDGNRQNCVIENLECVPRSVLAERNRMWNCYPRELAESIQLQGVLKRKLRKLNRA